MTITKVSEKFDLSADTLRYIEFIKCMRNAGLPIDVLIEYVTLVQLGDATIKARKELLTEQRKQLISRMEDMQKTLDRLNYKIERYEQAVVTAENELKRPED